MSLKTEALEKQEVEPRELDWLAAQSVAERKRSQTKRIVYEDYGGPGQALVFRIRQLTQADRDAIADSGVEVNRRGRGKVHVDAHAIRFQTLRRGIAEGPRGFVVTESNVAALDPDVVEDLVEAIGNFSTLSEEERRSFRGVR